MSIRIASVVAMLVVLCGTAEGQQQANVGSAVEAAQRELVREQVRLTRITMPQQGEEYVDASAVRTALLASQITLVAQLQASDLPGLAAYAQRFYPADPALVTVTAETHRVPLTPTEEATRAFAEANAFLGLIAEAGRRALDLRVTSQPPQAAFHIEAEGGGSARSTSTDADLRNLYRGYYTYTVSKSGYKPISARLNLVDEDGTVLVCRLVKSAQPEAATPCTLQ